LFYVVILRKSFKTITSFIDFDFSKNEKHFAYYFQSSKLFINDKYFYEINHFIIVKKYIINSQEDQQNRSLYKKKEINSPEVVV
jgi:hypothetical protein